MNIKKLIKEELKIFIMEKDLLQLVLAVYLGEVLKDFSTHGSYIFLCFINHCSAFQQRILKFSDVSTMNWELLQGPRY